MNELLVLPVMLKMLDSYHDQKSTDKEKDALISFWNYRAQKQRDARDIMLLYLLYGNHTDATNCDKLTQKIKEGR